MSDSLAIRRKFLVVTADAERSASYAKQIDAHISQATVFTAHDGPEALLKIDNDAPHVLLSEVRINRLDGIKLVEAVLRRKHVAEIAVILLSPIPDKEHFVDEVALGRVQFLNPAEIDLNIGKCLARALNYLSQSEVPEFRLRFLAPGDLLIRQGDIAESVYIVKRGTLKAFLGNQGSESVLGEISVGEFVGEMAYINGEPRSAHVTATSDCELIEIPVDHLDHLLLQKPAWSKALMKTLSKRIKIANQGRI